eukprot:6316352-Alexandrium_andersonii.AAC.1
MEPAKPQSAEQEELNEKLSDTNRVKIARRRLPNVCENSSPTLRHALRRSLQYNLRRRLKPARGTGRASPAFTSRGREDPNMRLEPK